MSDIKNRDSRVKVANETLEIINAGSYINSEGAKVVIKDSMDYAISESVLYKPEMFELLEAQIEERKNMSKDNTTKIEVTDETTIEASARLAVGENIQETVCLNFASAKNPGGGFLSGSQAQEESLARSSGLYPCISQMKEIYDYNRSHKTCLYSDYMIYSPKVPFFRSDDGRLLNQPFHVSVITAPAVNAGVVREREKENLKKIDEVMVGRIKKILTVAALQNDQAVILGAYGCGVFRNRAEDVAGYFRKVLIDDGFKVLFDKIVFAVYDNSVDKNKLNAFKGIFC